MISFGFLSLGGSGGSPVRGCPVGSSPVRGSNAPLLSDGSSKPSCHFSGGWNWGGAIKLDASCGAGSACAENRRSAMECLTRPAGGRPYGTRVPHAATRRKGAIRRQWSPAGFPDDRIPSRRRSAVGACGPAGRVYADGLCRGTCGPHGFR